MSAEEEAEEEGLGYAAEAILALLRREFPEGMETEEVADRLGYGKNELREGVESLERADLLDPEYNGLRLLSSEDPYRSVPEEENPDSGTESSEGPDPAPMVAGDPAELMGTVRTSVLVTVTRPAVGDSDREVIDGAERTEEAIATAVHEVFPSAVVSADVTAVEAFDKPRVLYRRKGEE